MQSNGLQLISNGRSNSSDPRHLSVAVIGAGSAGLIAARELVREGHSVVIFELSGGLGGLWVYTDRVEDDLLGRDPGRQRVHSSMYKDLRTNLPRQIMSVSDFPLTPNVLNGQSQDSRTYCSSQEVQAYFEAFADQFQLRQLIRYHTKAGPRWLVTTAQALPDESIDLASSQTQEFDAVVTCVGNYSEPNLPDDVDGMDSFPGRQLHCHNYRTNDAFVGQTVIVAGAAFSGDEICSRIAEVAGTVYHSARTWMTPDWHEKQALGKRQNIHRRTMLQSLHEDGSATFQEVAGVDLPGRVDGVDSVVYCTGYKYHYPFLEHLGVLSTDDMRVHPLYKHIFPPSLAPTLSFVGLLWRSLRFVQFELQAKWVARVLSGRVALPSREDMQADVEAFYQLLEDHDIPVRYTHSQGGSSPVTQWEYNDWLAEACGDVPKIAPWRRNLSDIAQRAILNRAEVFRDEATEEDLAALAEANRAIAAMTAHHRQTGKWLQID